MACFGTVCRNVLRSSMTEAVVTNVSPVTNGLVSTASSVIETVVAVVEPITTTTINAIDESVQRTTTVNPSIVSVEESGTQSWSGIVTDILILVAIIALGAFIKRRTKSIKRLITEDHPCHDPSEPMIQFEPNDGTIVVIEEDEV